MDFPQPINPPSEPFSGDDAVVSDPATDIPPPPSSAAVPAGEALKRKKKRRAVATKLSESDSSPSSCLCSKQRGFRLFNRRRNPRGPRQRDGGVGALALPLGMSIAAVLAQVLERKDAAAQNMSVDHLSKICTLAVRESLANAFGDQFESFVSNFEKSFRSTLMTLRLVNESSMKNVVEHQKPANRGASISEVNLHFKDRLEDSACDSFIQNGLEHQKPANRGTSISGVNLHLMDRLEDSECESSIQNGLEHQKSAFGGSSTLLEVNMHLPCRLEDHASYPGLSEFDLEPSLPSVSSDHQLSNQDEVNENMLVESMKQLTLHDRGITNQFDCFSSSTSYSAITKTNHSTFEKAVLEQARSNDLKKFEIGLMIRKLQLKEKQLAVNSQANLLERWKLSLGISRASFKAEKFKTQLEDARHAELLRTCIDCLVAGLFIMVVCLGYGTYVYSHKRITEATAACSPSTEGKSWWMPKSMQTFNSGLQTLKCHAQVLTRMLFGALMILAVAYLLLQRAAVSHHTMPITFILLLLGAGCGLAGKFCIDTLGGSGYIWLLYWEALCLLHFLSNLFISTLYIILNGPVTPVPEKTTRSTVYWMRRASFYFVLLFLLPFLCGLMPFAGPGEWRDHFSSLLFDDTDY